ncbi:MAG: hypothetical protein ABFD58_12685 [Anaerolineaceae bacterium]
MRLSNDSTTRSERIRARRNQQSQQRVTKAGEQVKRTTTYRPPVTVRGNTGTPVIKRAYNQPRRQYAISMGSSGVEMLTPSVPVIKPGWRLASAVLTAMFACLLILLTNMEQFRVKQPVLIGFERITAADLESILLVNAEPVFAINPDEIQSSLQVAFPELANISVHVNFPANLIISASERTPVISWEQDDTVQWIDAEGVIFPPRGDQIVPLTITSDGNAPMVLNTAAAEDIKAESNETITPDQVKPEFILAAQKLSEQLGTGAAIIYSESNGLGWGDPRGWKIYIGSTLDNLDAKIKVYNTLVDKLIAEGAQPTMINLEFIDAPYYRLEQ